MRIVLHSIITVFLFFFSFSTYAAVDTSVGRSDVQTYAGSFNYSVPIAVAPGVTGVQPDLTLHYSSGLKNGLYGQGWDMNLSRIERSTKKGKPTYTDADTFVLIMNGAAQTLVHVGGNQYRVRSEGAFLKISKGSTYWLVQDKKGTRYYFGWDGYRQNSRWPAGAVQSFSWNLSYVANARGKTINYFYYNDAYGHRLARIDYAPNNHVYFYYELRRDIQTSYRSGYNQRTAVRLRRIRTLANGAWSHHQEFLYTSLAKDTTQLSLLSQSIQHSVIAGVKPKVTTFGYNSTRVSSTAFRSVPTTWNDPKGHPSWAGYISNNNSVGGYRQLVDMNGDGLPDRVTNDPYRASSLQVFLNTGRGFNSTPIIWHDPKGHPSWQSYVSNNNSVGGYRQLIDMNGDGLVDRVTNDPYRASSLQVFLNTGRGFSSTAIIWHDPKGHPSWQSYVTNNNSVGGYRQLMDMNGDGLVDRVTNDPYRVSSLQVFLNTGRGFSSTPILWHDPKGHPNWQSYVTNNNSVGGYRQLMDINGDGLVDRVTNDPYRASSLQVFLNTGSGFSSTPTLWHDPKGHPSWQSYVTNNNSVGGYRQLMDMNGDGRLDRVTNDPYRVNSLQIFLNTGSGFNATPILWHDPKGHPSWGSYVINNNSVGSYRQLIDMNGDGLVDRVTNDPYRANSLQWASSLFQTPLLTRVSEPAGAISNVYYTSSRYTTGSRIPYNTWVVSRMTRSGIVAGEYRSTRYSYSGGLFDRTSKEFRGFRSVTSVDEQSGISNMIYYHQDLIYQGRPYYSVTRQSNGLLINISRTTWLAKQYDPLNGAYRRHFPYVYQTVTYNYEVDGRFGIQTTIRNYYDNFGNAYGVDTSTSDGYRTWVRNTYSNDTNRWFLGRLTRAMVYKAGPGQATQVRISDFAYNWYNEVFKETVEPTRPTLTQTMTHSYDWHGNRIATTVSGAGVVARTTRTAYDGWGLFPLSNSNALGHTERYSWDRRWAVKTALSGPNGLTTRWYYDGFGRNTSELRADGTRTNITYNTEVSGSAGYWRLWVRKDTTAQPPQITYFDSYGRERLNQSANFNGRTVYQYTAYDRLGRVAYQTTPYVSWTGKMTRYAYDPFGRPVTVWEADGSVSRTAYVGRWTYITNAKGQVKKIYKNSLGKVLYTIDPANGWTVYGYDQFGNLIQTRAGGVVTTIGYDMRGRKIWVNDPDMGYLTYTYNAFGELISQRDAKGQVSTMAYDQLGRMVMRSEREGISRWTYDTAYKGIGKLAHETAANGSQKTYAYDLYGRLAALTTQVNGGIYTVRTSYDGVGRVSMITYPTGLRVQRVYKAYSYLHQIKNAATGAVFWTANSADAGGRLVSETFGNGVVTSRGYDVNRGTLNTIRTSRAGVNIQTNNYYYDALGNLTRRIDYQTGLDEWFGYDVLNRLISASGPTPQSFRYDALGNITYKSDVGNYTYNPAAKPHAVRTAGVNSYAYDANGNMTSGSGRTYAWTSFNKPLGITTAQGYTGFGYDANHQRISKTTPNSSTIYIGKLYERTVMGAVTKRTNYIHASGKLVAAVEDVNGRAETKYMHTDHLGSISVITGSNGAVLERLSYDAFGKPRQSNGTAGNVVSSHTSRGYTGHEMDASTGLINMNARLYDPVLGRFISPDSIVPDAADMQSYNRYSYVNNNPLAYTDPTGHWSLKNLWKAVKQVVVVAVIIAAAAVTYGAVAGALGAGFLGGGFIGSVATGAIAGAAAGFVGGATGATLAGANSSQIWRAGLAGARTGAIAGAVAGGISWGGAQLGAPADLTRMVAGGAGNSANGGNFESIVQSMLFVGVGIAMEHIYTSIVGYDVDANAGGDAVRKGDTQVPNIGRNNIGTQGNPVPKPSDWQYWLTAREGSLLSKALNLIPGVNAVSGVHDTFQINLDGMWREVLNVPGMVPAVFITAGALIPAVPVSVLDQQIRQ